ncbi:S-layer homology domain-containing protein [Myxosarcina sp. GI1(2024)]
MTNLSPQPPENNEPQRRRPVLTFDEMIGVIVAFAAIGAILFWSLGNKIRLNGVVKTDDRFLSLRQDEDDLEERSDTEPGFNRILSPDEDSEEIEQRTSRYLDRQPVTSAVPSDRRVIFARPEEDGFRIDSRARLVPTPLSLDSIIEQPEVMESPQIESPPPVRTLPESETPETELPETETPETSVAETPETETPEAAIEFEDVSPDYWAYPFIAELAERDLVSGSSENLFEPDKLITRASMASLISTAFDQPETEVMKNFADVTEDNATAADINKAVDMGFMKGYSNREFRPLENIPRYQVLVALATGLNLEPPQDVEATLQQFRDGDRIPEWATEQVAAAIEAGLLVNRPDYARDALNPNQSATRSEAAAAVYQALVETGKLEAIDSEYIVRP